MLFAIHPGDASASASASACRSPLHLCPASPRQDAQSGKAEPVMPSIHLLPRPLASVPIDFRTLDSNGHSCEQLSLAWPMLTDRVPLILIPFLGRTVPQSPDPLVASFCPEKQQANEGASLSLSSLPLARPPARLSPPSSSTPPSSAIALDLRIHRIPSQSTPNLRSLVYPFRTLSLEQSHLTT